MVDKNLSSDFYSLSSNYYDISNMNKEKIQKLLDNLRILFKPNQIIELKDFNILNQYKNNEDSENIQIGMIIFRIIYYFNLSPQNNNFIASCFIQGLEFINDCIDKETKKVLLYFTLNYSRGLLDHQNQYVIDFSRDFSLFSNAYQNQNRICFQFKDYKEKITDSNLKNEDKTILIEAFKFFYEVISKSNHFKNSIDGHIKYLNINDNIDNFLDSIPSIIFSILEDDSGVLGTVIGNNEIIIQINHLKKLDDTQKCARLILQIIHELGHFIVRFYNGYLSFSPRRSDGELKELEAGYLLENYVFGYYDKQIWTSSDFCNYIFKKESWNNYNLTIDVSNIKNRSSNFNTSGIEQFSKFSSIE